MRLEKTTVTQVASLPGPLEFLKRKTYLEQRNERISNQLKIEWSGINVNEIKTLLFQRIEIN